MTDPRGLSGQGFITDLVVSSVSPDVWMLESDLVWVGKKDDVITVPAGEETDFATVPRILQSFTPRTGAWTKAAVIHDMLCRLLAAYWLLLENWARNHADEVPPPEPPTFNAVDTDNVFRLIMEEDGVKPWRADVMWAAVRWAALFNPARRAGWWDTAPRLLAISLAVLVPVLAVLAGLATLAAVVIPL
jgi:hypothetical protein